MANDTLTENSIDFYKKKLQSSLDKRKELERQFSNQLSILFSFITKLTSINQGIEQTFDDEFSTLRHLLKNYKELDDLNAEISSLTQQLEQHSIASNKKMVEIDHIIEQAISNLQTICEQDKFEKLNNINNKSTKKSLTQYIPILLELISLYQSIIDINITKSNSHEINQLENRQVISKVILVKFTHILESLKISEKSKKSIDKIKQNLTENTSKTALVNNCINIFELIIEDLEKERNSSKTFLSSLNKTLESVQASVSSTISVNKTSSHQNSDLTIKLKEQLEKVTADITEANSLNDLKVDINDKLQQLGNTLDKKSSIEESQNSLLEQEFSKLQEKVKALEKQGKVFESRIKHQQELLLQDPLTKLNNRAAFNEYFQKKLIDFTNRPFQLAITVVDLDDFKKVNDTYGHIAGDKTLQVVADTIETMLDNNDFVARYGGEEFVIISNYIDQDALMLKLNAIRKKIALLPFKFKNNRVIVTLSMGTTFIQENDNEFIAFERADAALYKAKKEGKNRVIYR